MVAPPGITGKFKNGVEPAFGRARQMDAERRNPAFQIPEPDSGADFPPRRRCDPAAKDRAPGPARPSRVTKPEISSVENIAARIRNKQIVGRAGTRPRRSAAEPAEKPGPARGHSLPARPADAGAARHRSTESCSCRLCDLARAMAATRPTAFTSLRYGSLSKDSKPIHSPSRQLDPCQRTRMARCSRLGSASRHDTPAANSRMRRSSDWPGSGGFRQHHRRGSCQRPPARNHRSTASAAADGVTATPASTFERSGELARQRLHLGDAGDRADAGARLLQTASPRWRGREPLPRCARSDAPPVRRNSSTRAAFAAIFVLGHGLLAGPQAAVHLAVDAAGMVGRRRQILFAAADLEQVEHRLIEMVRGARGWRTGRTSALGRVRVVIMVRGNGLSSVRRTNAGACRRVMRGQSSGKYRWASSR